MEDGTLRSCCSGFENEETRLGESSYGDIAVVRDYSQSSDIWNGTKLPSGGSLGILFSPSTTRLRQRSHGTLASRRLDAHWAGNSDGTNVPMEFREARGNGLLVSSGWNQLDCLWDW